MRFGTYQTSIRWIGHERFRLILRKNWGYVFLFLILKCVAKNVFLF